MNRMVTISILLVTAFLEACITGGYMHHGYWHPFYYGPGIGLGTIIAVVISWSRNKSILWAIIHGILGWLYVIYAALVPKKD